VTLALHTTAFRDDAALELARELRPRHDAAD
jgi:hypothetical protein